MPAAAGSDTAHPGTGADAGPAQSPSQVEVPDRAGPGRSPAGRHAAADAVQRRPTATGRSVLIIGGAEPMGAVVAERLDRAGHRLAVNAVDPPSHGSGLRHRHAESARASQPLPVALSGDRRTADDIADVVAAADIALDGLETVVILPGPRSALVGMDADPGAWADAWSHVLASEVLAAASAAHAAARSFLTHRRAGRIILVAGGPGGPAGLPGSTAEAAVTALGGDLARELGPRGVSISVVTSGPGAAADFAVSQIADLVEALVSTPVLSGVTVRVG